MSKVLKPNKCEHDWSFYGESSDGLVGCFACNLCGDEFQSEGVPDIFNQPDSITDQLQVELLRYPFTTTLKFKIMDERGLKNQAIDELESIRADKDRLDFIQDKAVDLRCESVDTGGGDYDIQWVVIQHHMTDPKEREIGRGYNDFSIREAIDQAMKVEE